jgi:LysR family transcriptional regulator, chromosome initiation inhibitor
MSRSDDHDPLRADRDPLPVVKGGTFDAAARTLHVTPSAVSQRIKVLEQRVGRVLVVRSRPVRATEAGEALLRLGQQLALLETETLRQLGTERDDDGFTTLPIAVDADSLATWILPPLARVAAREPVVLHLVRDDQDHTADLLASGAVMAAVTSSAVPVPGCTSTRLGRMRFRAHATPAVRGPVLGMGWAMLPDEHSAVALEAGTLVDLAPGRHLDVPLHRQQWNLRSGLIDAVAAEVQAEAERVLS